jgi:CCR4-NOT transcriptional regulation complex NOT5 subunit
LSNTATGSGTATTAPGGRTVRRAALALAAGVAITAVAACGSSGSSPQPSPSTSSPSASASPLDSTGAAAAKVTVGSTSLQKSTLASGPAAFETNKNVKQTSQGLAVTAPANGATVALNADSNGIPSSLEIGVTVTPPTTPKTLFGVGCQGDYLDLGQQYAALVDATGGWEIAEQKSKHITTLAGGHVQLPAGDVQLNLVCAQVKSPKCTTRLSFAINNKIVKTVDHTDPNLATGNGFQLVVADPGSGTAGTATFHNLDVRSATAL